MDKPNLVRIVSFDFFAVRRDSPLDKPFGDPDFDDSRIRLGEAQSQLKQIEVPVVPERGQKGN